MKEFYDQRHRTNLSFKSIDYITHEICTGFPCAFVKHSRQCALFLGHVVLLNPWGIFNTPHDIVSVSYYIIIIIICKFCKMWDPINLLGVFSQINLHHHLPQSDVCKIFPIINPCNHLCTKAANQSLKLGLEQCHISIESKLGLKAS